MEYKIRQQICNTTSNNIDLESIIPQSHLTPESVDSLINFEMKNITAKYMAEEECFVEQKLIENPVVCARRKSTRSGSDSSSSARGLYTLDALKQQRADACRRSRINNKIKKAKSKFRHKFVTMKLGQNAADLTCIRDAIADAENRLRINGISEATLQKLRGTMGIDRMDIDNLSELAKLGKN